MILGWEEWIALPELALPAIKAKVDTGAKTSALHASSIERIGPPGQESARFIIRPAPRRAEIAVTCTAPIVDMREVTSSNGEREYRPVIVTMLRIAGQSWPIEVTLTNRESMGYRMLIGRQALREGLLVDPSVSFHQPRLSYRLYGAKRRRK